LIEDVRGRVPELPGAKRARFVRDYGVTEYDAGVLANDLELAAYFEAAAKDAKNAKTIANWILNDLQSALTKSEKTMTDCDLAPETLRELIGLTDEGKISGSQAREVFNEMLATGKGAAAIVKEKGIEQLSDLSALEALCDQVVAAHPKSVADFQRGQAAALNFLKGQVMKLSGGKANPHIIGDVLQRKLTAQGGTD
jgi:aspartyl-tRNA(Asn)/glutamyl-tRNA(Gln) amidotransferase subunit B